MWLHDMDDKAFEVDRKHTFEPAPPQMTAIGLRLEVLAARLTNLRRRLDALDPETSTAPASEPLVETLHLVGDLLQALHDRLECHVT
jgi:hypothetical protein